MNSATYKRAFKPVSSVASIDGRHNPPPGGGSSQPEAASGGPVSTTSNVLNLGESKSNDNEGRGQATTGDGLRRNFGCFEFQCHYIGFLECIRRLWRRMREFRPSVCWLATKNWFMQCCSVGEIGPTAVYELGIVNTSCDLPDGPNDDQLRSKSVVDPDSI